MTDRLPLPEPVNFSDVHISGNDDFNQRHAVLGYTADQMRAHEAAVRADERERIARWWDGRVYDGVGGTYVDIAASIRSAPKG